MTTITMPKNPVPVVTIPDEASAVILDPNFYDITDDTKVTVDSVVVDVTVCYSREFGMEVYAGGKGGMPLVEVTGRLDAAEYDRLYDRAAYMWEEQDGYSDYGRYCDAMDRKRKDF